MLIGQSQMLDMNELIGYAVSGTAEWRRRKAEDFPEDIRNIKAAEILDLLESELGAFEGSPEHLRLVDAAARDEDATFSETLSELTRSIGFRWFPVAADEFLHVVITDIERELSLVRYGSAPSDRGQPSLVLQTVIIPADQSSEGQIIKAVAEPWFEIIRWLDTDPSRAFRIPFRLWEEIIAGAYKRAGFDEVILTPRSADRGRDVIATKKGLGIVRVIDQVKAYGPKHYVTHDDARALYGVLIADGASKGFLTTTSEFAPTLSLGPLLAPLIPSRLELINGSALMLRLKELSRRSRG
jgi:restriction system protein